MESRSQKQQLTPAERRELHELEAVVHATGLCLASRLTEHDLAAMDAVAWRTELWQKEHTGPDVLAPLDQGGVLHEIQLRAWARMMLSMIRLAQRLDAEAAPDVLPMTRPAPARRAA